MTEVIDNILKTQKLGDVLLERGVITQQQLQKALEKQKKDGGYLGEILVHCKYIEERDVVAALVVQCHFPYIAIDKYDIPKNIIDLIPKAIVVQYKLISLDRVGDVLSVVMMNPLDKDIQIELRKITGCRIVPFIAEKSEIERAINRWYEE